MIVVFDCDFHFFFRRCRRFRLCRSGTVAIIVYTAEHVRYTGLRAHVIHLSAFEKSTADFIVTMAAGRLSCAALDANL